MEKYLRYAGEFLSRAGVTWRVEILQDAETAFASVGSLTFEADEALVIEWGHSEKEEVICGSTATLKVESPGDRTYEDLYTIAPGCIRMDVYRNNALYWSGALDPEFYEEPYERAANYPVSLTFSDFGILDRLKYDLSDMQTLQDIVSYSIERSTINAVLDQSMISTRLNAAAPSAMSLSDIKVRSDNFYDEDGEALSLKEVMEGILQPLALRMVQRAGRIYIYDLNALYSQAPVNEVIWDGDSQTMGVDKVYNNVKITWSPYRQTGVLTEKDVWIENYDENETCHNSAVGKVVGNSHIWSYPSTTEGYEGWQDKTDVGFTLWTSAEGENLTIENSGAKFYKIIPQIDGQESEGIAVMWPGVRMNTSHYSSADDITVRSFGMTPGQLKGTLSSATSVIFSSDKVSLPPVSHPAKLCLRIGVEMLMDPRFNPFESSARWTPAEDQKHWEAQWATQGNFVFVPVSIKFQSNDGALYTWNNLAVISKDVSGGSAVRHYEGTMGMWSPGTQSKGWLAWYSSDQEGSQRAETSGAIGWKKNRPAINPHRQDITVGLAHTDSGQYIPYPNFGNKGGSIWIEVLAGSWMISDAGVNLSSAEVMNPNGLWDKFHWVLFKAPEIEIMKNTLYDKEIESEDVEYNAEINPDAKDDLELDTICGSCEEGIPVARGAYYSSETGLQITELTRAGRTSQVEDLLIGTLFSQFGQRRTKLSGEMQIATHALSSYTEANQPGKIFLITEDIQDVISDVSEATVIELRPDEYERRS